jgi:hypothetical protein
MRWTRLIAGIGLLSGAIGCHHVAGFCDCIPPVHPCAIYGLHVGGDHCGQGGVIVVDPKAPPPAKVDTPAPPPAVTPPPGSPML